MGRRANFRTAVVFHTPSGRMAQDSRNAGHKPQARALRTDCEKGEKGVQKELHGMQLHDAFAHFVRNPTHPNPAQ